MLDELRSSQQIHRFDKGYSQYQNGLAPSMPEAHAVRRVLRFVRERERHQGRGRGKTGSRPNTFRLAPGWYIRLFVTHSFCSLSLSLLFLVDRTTPLESVLARPVHHVVKDTDRPFHSGDGGESHLVP